MIYFISNLLHYATNQLYKYKSMTYLLTLC